MYDLFQAHKIQSPHEQEAVISLAVLEACVKSCGTDFHCEVGKFRDDSERKLKSVTKNSIILWGNFS